MGTLETPQERKSSFAPDVSWTQQVPQSKRLNCIAAAEEVFTQAEQKLAQVEKTGSTGRRSAARPLCRGCRAWKSTVAHGDMPAI